MVWLLFSEQFVFHWTLEKRTDTDSPSDVDRREAVETADGIALSLQLPQRVLAMRLDVAACWHQNHAPRVVHPSLPLKPSKRRSRADHRMPTPRKSITQRPSRHVQSKGS